LLYQELRDAEGIRIQNSIMMFVLFLSLSDLWHKTSDQKSLIVQSITLSLQIYPVSNGSIYTWWYH